MNFYHSFWNMKWGEPPTAIFPQRKVWYSNIWIHCDRILFWPYCGARQGLGDGALSAGDDRTEVAKMPDKRAPRRLSQLFLINQYLETHF